MIFFCVRKVIECCFNSLPTSGDFSFKLITFANSLDPDQDRQSVGPDLNPNCFMRGSRGGGGGAGGLDLLENNKI